MSANHNLLTETLFVVSEPTDDFSALLALLAEYGYQVRSSNYSDQLLDILKTEPPALILLSSSQQYDRYQFCQTLREVELLRLMPILFICGTQDAPFDLARALHMGGTDYLSYPLRREEVITRIEHQLTMVRLQRKLALQDSQLSQVLEQCQYLKTALNRATEKIEQVSSIDSLTQLPNRRYFDEYLEQQWRRIARDRLAWGEQISLSVILCVLEGAKPLSLQQIARAIKKLVKRPADLVAYYGECELALLLPNTSQEGVLHLVNTIESHLQTLPLATPVTLRLGIATEIPTQALAASTLIDVAKSDLQAKS